MTTFLVAASATAVSLLGLAYLAAVDPKRRRSFGLAAPRHPGLAMFVWPVVFLPGIVLLLLGQSAGFVLWFACVTVAGWRLAAMAPAAGGTLRQRIAAVVALWKGSGRPRTRY